jgi:hypothetical protein
MAEVGGKIVNGANLPYCNCAEKDVEIAKLKRRIAELECEVRLLKSSA